MRLHSDAAFDRLLVRSLSVTAVGAADATTIAGAGTQIAPGDVVSWERYWRHQGDRSLERADRRLTLDDVSGAGRNMLCASWAYGLAAHFYRALPTSEMWQTNRVSQISAFRAAIPLLPDECEPLAMSGRTGPLHGYQIGDRGDTCVLIPVGADASVEDAYALFAPAASAAGVRCLAVDLSVGGDIDIVGTALNWLRKRSSAVFVLGWGAITPRVVAAVHHREDLHGVLCCPAADDVAAVCDLLPGLDCPSVLLPPGSPVHIGFGWLPSVVA